MSLAGRPRKPVALKKLDGSYREDRANVKAPRAGAATEIPAPPSDLSEREAAAWRELAEVVGPLQVTTRADLVAFRQMATTLAVVEEARDTVRTQGLTYTLKTESGEVIRKRPEVEILIAFKRQLAAELARFGLTPADRERVSAIGDDSPGDPLDEFAVRSAG